MLRSVPSVPLDGMPSSEHASPALHQDPPLGFVSPRGASELAIDCVVVFLVAYVAIGMLKQGVLVRRRLKRA